MAKFSRDKGKRFERKIARILRERFPQFAEAIRRSIQSREAEESDVTGIPNLWLECQDAVDPTPLAKLKQAIGDMPYKHIPVAITHKTKTRSIEVSMRMMDLIFLQRMMDRFDFPLTTALVQMDLDTFLTLIERAKPWEKKL